MFVKICGTTSEGDALLAVAMGADAVGFVFAPSSRQVAPSVAADIATRLPPEILTVGVFRDESPQRVVDIMKSTGLKAAQLHGREKPEDTAWIRRRVRMVIKAFPASKGVAANIAEYDVDAVILDGPEPGTGQVFDWRLADGVPQNRRLLLAGGLDPDNVADAIARVKPWGVDVVSGVESRPGVKDPRRLRSFVAAAKAAAPLAYEPVSDGPYDWQEGPSWR